MLIKMCQTPSDVFVCLVLSNQLSKLKYIHRTKIQNKESSKYNIYVARHMASLAFLLIYNKQ